MYDCGGKMDSLNKTTSNNKTDKGNQSNIIGNNFNSDYGVLPNYNTNQNMYNTQNLDSILSKGKSTGNTSSDCITGNCANCPNTSCPMNQNENSTIDDLLANYSGSVNMMGVPSDSNDPTYSVDPSLMYVALLGSFLGYLEKEGYITKPKSTEPESKLKSGKLDQPKYDSKNTSKQLDYGKVIGDYISALSSIYAGILSGDYGKNSNNLGKSNALQYQLPNSGLNSSKSYSKAGSSYSKKAA